MTKFIIPDAAFSQHTITLGKTRSGKSSKMRLIVERLLDKKQPVCVLDPKGDWWGLKSSASGKEAGYPVIIFGGEHADVPINEHAGAHIAELIATGNRPCIIDLGGWMVGARTRFFIDFASTLFKLTKGPRWLVIDECHNFAPQGRIMDPDAGKMLHWANRLASEGAGKGLTLISASQRPQKVHKDFVTSHETLIAARVIHMLDRNAIKDWIDGCADPEKGKEVIKTLAGMNRSEAWVWSPEIDFGPERIRFPMFATYDSFKPQAHDAPATLKGWAAVNLDDVKQKLATVVEEAKANDPKTLRSVITDLKRQLSQRQTPAPIPQLSESDKTRIFLDGERSGFARGTAAIMSELNASLKHMTAVAYVPSQQMPTTKALVPVLRLTMPSVKKTDGIVSPSARKIIDAIHSANPLSLSFAAAAARAGISKRSSAYRSYQQEVVHSEEIEADHERLRSAPGFTTATFSHADPIETWVAKLPPSFGKMLKSIADAPLGLTKDEIAAAAFISPTSSGLGSGLRELMDLHLIEKQGEHYRLVEGIR